MTADGEAHPPRWVLLEIGTATFGILALELAMIRWMSGQVRIFAYFNNLVLIGAFLGMGLGLALGRRHRGLHDWTLPALLALSVPLAFSEPLHLMHMHFPDAAIALWGAEGGKRAVEDVISLVAFMGLFVAVVALFVLAGSALGALFGRAAPLRAYSADLLGSLLGVVVFTLATTFNAGPPMWLLIAGLPFALLSRRRWWSWGALAAVIGLGSHSVAGAYFSPYNRIDLVQEGHDYELAVNRDFHQYMLDLSDATVRDPAWPPETRALMARFRLVYDAPFVINPARGRALVVGAGTGNDVQAALRNGYGSVHSVDIDGRIIALGRRFHPEHPYDDPRAIPVVNDARAFFEQYRGEPFDAIVYGLLDSHAMFSALSSLRLDNYVYTEEGIRAAWRHVSDRGHLSVSFCLVGGSWLRERLYWTIARATGVRPVMLYHGILDGCTFLVARPSVVLDLGPVAVLQRVVPAALPDVRTTTDDWPFLYIRPRVFPWGYLGVLTAVLVLAFFSARRVFGARAVGAEFDPLLFMVGAGFLLIETRGVTTLSLLFGSTWVVNAAVFAGILLVALLANLYVERFGAPPLELCFGLLLASVVLLWAIDNAALNRLSLPVRGVLGGLINALPVGFAGIIVSTLLARSSNPTASLASNLLGSVVGGCLEYLSMMAGLRALALLALAIYLVAFLVYRRRGTTASVAWNAETA